MTVGRWRVGSVAAVLALTVGSLALPTGIAGADGTTQVAAVQGNVPGEGMNPFAERRAVLNNHAQATTDFAQQVKDGERPQPDLVIWPENSTDIDPYDDRSAYDQIDFAVKAIDAPDPGRRGRERPGRRTTCATWASCGARRPDRGSST